MSILASTESRILVQGITGREATIFTRESIQYGAHIMAGVSPGKGGNQVHGVPVFDTVEEALLAEPCSVSIISVPPPFVLDATMEALAHELQLIVIITERVPRRDIVSILEWAEEVGTRIVGPNSLGIISPDQTRIGMCGGAAKDLRRAYTSGPIGIISRSGGMMTEIASLLTQEGIGQSTCVSIGGDPIIGSTFLDLLPVFEADSETQALVLFCEPGGNMEERLAEHCRSHDIRLPIIAFVAGRFADRFQRTRFGHAGAIVEGTRGSPTGKMIALQEAGVRVAEKISTIPQLIRELL